MHYGISFFQTETHILIAVEVSFDIQLIVAKHLIAPEHTEEDGCSRRSGAETPAVDTFCRHWYEIRGKTVGRYDVSHIVPSPHSHHPTNAHGKLRIFAHKQKVRGFRILKAAELIVIVCGDYAVDAVDLLTRVSAMPDFINHCAGRNRIAHLVDFAFCRRRKYAAKCGQND